MKKLIPLLLLFGAVDVFAADCVTWNVVQADIRKVWPVKYKNEKIISIEKKGGTETYKKMIGTGKTKKDANGEVLELFVEKEFCSQGAIVKVKQASGERIFNTSWIYLMNGKQVKFYENSVGESEAVASGDEKAPDKTTIKDLIAKAFVRDVDSNAGVEKVATSDPEFKKSGSRSWYALEADVHITKDGEKKKCDVRYISLEKKSGKWDISFGDTHPSCSAE